MLMMTKDQMDREAESRAFLLGLKKDDIPRLDSYILNNHANLPPSHRRLLSSRIKYLKRVGALKCGCDNNGVETTGRTNFTQSFLRRSRS